ncbi:MAG TPA: NAD(P)H-hydrate dehydratase [Smithella sp.]|nr:NAD(P)H-hydrate dehydratase [Smithella sp.]
MLLVCGTIPQENAELIKGEAVFEQERLLINGLEIPCTQGTAALISAACATAKHLKSAPPQALLAGDTGKGKGSHLLYDYLISHLSELNPDVLLMHYILPVMGQMKKVVVASTKCKKKPVLMADASSMYAAKGAGLAPEFDIFTPDICELAFLADPDAVHPAYIKHHLFTADGAQAEVFIGAAYRQKGAAKILIAKGSTDYVVEKGKIAYTVSEPDIPILEAIGGTGDTISGMTGAMVDTGMAFIDAAVAALKANRKAGELVSATPATRISQIIAAIPDALKNIL